METARRLPRLSFGSGGIEQGSRPLPEEVAVALSFNGSTQAVMMATPADLVDFAYGFALTEGIATPDQIDSVDIVPAGDGVDVQVWLADDAEKRLAARRRTMAGPVGCGLCGIDSIEQAIERAGTKAGNKGYDAAMSAIEMVNLIKENNLCAEGKRES